MPKSIVTNTSPLLALIAAWGNLQPLQALYQKVFVPWEVSEEIRRGGTAGFGIAEFEAAVIQLALNENIDTVCI